LASASLAQNPQPSWLTEPVDDLTIVAAVHGAFYGCTMPAGGLEGLIAAHVPKKHIKDVSDLYERRWWDYRRLSPGHSFYLFAHHYYRACKLSARRLISERRSGFDRRGNMMVNLKGHALAEMTAERIWERGQSHITGIWKAMLISDGLGIPYPEFSRLACKVAIERLWKQLPRPSQLYSEKLAIGVMDEWDAIRKAKFFTAHHPVYSLDNYDGRRQQEAYRAYLIEQLKEQTNKVPALATALFFRPQLPVDLAEKHFPAQLIARAKTLAG
jgi:hypothetical protein